MALDGWLAHALGIPLDTPKGMKRAKASGEAKVVGPPPVLLLFAATALLQTVHVTAFSLVHSPPASGLARRSSSGSTRRSNRLRGEGSGWGSPSSCGCGRKSCGKRGGSQQQYGWREEGLLLRKSTARDGEEVQDGSRKRRRGDSSSRRSRLADTRLAAASTPTGSAGGGGDKARGLTRRDLLSSAALAATTGTAAAAVLTAFPQVSKAAAAAALGGSGSPASGSFNYVPPELVWTPVNEAGQAAASGTGTYSPRFTAYLARFLLNFDPRSMYWWEQQKRKVPRDKAEALARELMENGSDAVFRALDLNKDGEVDKEEFFVSLSNQKSAFSGFQASVSFGLRNYQGKDGTQRLFTLLMDEFGRSLSNKRQIALLFSLLDSEQPTQLIKKLIAETDNSSVESYKVVNGGSGYSPRKPPLVTVEKPLYKADQATAKCTLKPTGRLFRIKVLSGGKGYTSPPEVTVSSPAWGRGESAKAIATIKGGQVAGIVLTNQGKDYSPDDPLIVSIGLPTPKDANVIQDLESVMGGASAEAVLEWCVSSVEVVDPGSGYAHSIPPKVTVEPPPDRNEFANFGQAAKVEAVLSESPGGLILTSWLPTPTMNQEVTTLLPSNLVPSYDPCLGKFYISPVPVQDPNYCVYFAQDNFEVYPSEKMSRYFSFLDGPRARYPVEKERQLDLGVFLRFAACGAVCGSAAHALLVPIDVVKTRMQSEPEKYKGMVGAFKTIVKEEGKEAFLLGAGATTVGYMLYGGFSFGLTEFFKRKFVEFAGPGPAALYPVPILLLASACAATFAATAVTPFEAIRIRTVTVKDYPKSLVGALKHTLETGEVGDLFYGVPVLLLAEIPFMMTKFAVFDFTSKLTYSLFPVAADSVTLSLLVSLVSGMIAGVMASLVSQPSDTIMTEVSEGGHEAGEAEGGEAGAGAGRGEYEESGIESSLVAAAESKVAALALAATEAEGGGGGEEGGLLAEAAAEAEAAVAALALAAKGGAEEELQPGLALAAVKGVEEAASVGQNGLVDEEGGLTAAAAPAAAAPAAAAASAASAAAAAGDATSSLSAPEAPPVPQELHKPGGVNIPEVAARLIREGGGPLALYSGALPRSIKSAVNIAVQFFLYDFCKRVAMVSPDDIKVFFDVMSGLEVNDPGLASKIISGAANIPTP